jgi:hypothetical protein
MWNFVMDKSGAGAGFLRELRFPLPIYISSASPHSFSLSPEAGTIGQESPQCQYPLKPELKKKKNFSETETSAEKSDAAVVELDWPANVRDQKPNQRRKEQLNNRQRISFYACAI